MCRGYVDTTKMQGREEVKERVRGGERKGEERIKTEEDQIIIQIEDQTQLVQLQINYKLLYCVYCTTRFYARASTPRARISFPSSRRSASLILHPFIPPLLPLPSDLDAFVPPEQ